MKELFNSSPVTIFKVICSNNILFRIGSVCTFSIFLSENDYSIYIWKIIFLFFSDVNGNINVTSWSNNRFVQQVSFVSNSIQMIFHYSIMVTEANIQVAIGSNRCPIKYLIKTFVRGKFC